MAVVGDAGARDPSDVPAEVEALRPVDGTERIEASRAEPVNLQDLGLVEIVEIETVAVRRDEQMPRRIRELVQQHERALAAVHDEVLFVIAFRGAAEHAAVLLVRALDVLETPRRPQPLHRASVLEARCETSSLYRPRMRPASGVLARGGIRASGFRHLRQTIRRCRSA